MDLSTISVDPIGDLFADRAFRDAHFDALCRDHVDRARLIDEADLLCPVDATPDEAQEAFEGLFDIERIARRQRALVAEQDRVIDAVLTRAETDTVPWLGPDPALDPAWVDPRDRDVRTVRRHRVQLAVRAAAADLATRLRLSENAVRSRGHRARVLSRRCPVLWSRYLGGDICEQNAATVATLADSLPDRMPHAWQRFDETLADAAAALTPGRFRTRARAVRERVHPTSLGERHARAMGDRAVWIAPELDGMATLTALLPATGAHAIDNLLERHARHLAARPDEHRTSAQLRADAFCDLLTTLVPPVDASSADRPAAPAPAATVHLTIPALSLLGRSDEPATLDGYGPIDIDTARDLAATATSLVRVLTHPVTGTVVDIDRTAYRVPADLRRWLRVHHPTCVFPGCRTPADRCDIDHRTRWADGGTTSAENTAPVCRSHHVLKEETAWRMRRDPRTGEITWTSPTGNAIPCDPAPF
ncbi:HNH endonuclease signature motif containing protein [Microbacterium sp. No. 7]|uniref:HNH endonuclease signature motif containing protein n=1 Tax=Microbacterium sp. No. 7 TaxID=1714373 RepID=UPI0006D0ED3F|nr:HNH endonuclease signature motif containing protein [Microbacterium sp. No. 7]